MAGSFGVAGSFSFYPTKVIAGGEGGMIVTNDPHFVDEAKIYRDQGKASFLTNDHTRLGYNWRMSEPHAAIALSQLRRLDEFVAHRRHVAARYDAGPGRRPGRHRSPSPTNSGSNYYKYVAFLPPDTDRAMVKKRIREEYEVGALRRGVRAAAAPPVGVRAVGRRPAARRRGAVRPPHLPARVGRHDRRAGRPASSPPLRAVVES